MVARSLSKGTVDEFGSRSMMSFKVWNGSDFRELSIV